ncbi:microfibril-associated glycoprotein 4-like [Genypterus blacodes]|uniref:microfibril-associated glycoprotein 4-like n=1 Tax=Genypterus blacodes TaxID=154954 RepID=UPI003F776AD2
MFKVLGRSTTDKRMMLRVVLSVLLPVAAYPSPPPVDCSDIYRAGLGQDGVYTIYPAGPTSPVQVYCEMSNDQLEVTAEKWTVIQRRQDGTVSFYRKWDHYKTGFGSAAGEYWLGLETMHLLTKTKSYELRVNLEDFDGQQVYAHYSSFAVGPETDGYRLTLGSFLRGAAGDSLTAHNGNKFTTTDKDQDTHNSNCARLCFGGFWYTGCFRANPNGVYTYGPAQPATGASWDTFRGVEYSLKYIAMKIRPVVL